MRTNLKGEYYDSSFLLAATFTWIISSLLLLLIATILLNEIGCSEQGFGYASSLITFLSAFAAGISAVKKRKTGLIYTALLTASVLVTALLTLGFIIDGPALEPSAILSIISFTFSGCLSAAVCDLIPINKQRKHRPRI